MSSHFLTQTSELWALLECWSKPFQTAYHSLYPTCPHHLFLKTVIVLLFHIHSHIPQSKIPLCFTAWCLVTQCVRVCVCNRMCGKNVCALKKQFYPRLAASRTFLVNKPCIFIQLEQGSAKNRLRSFMCKWKHTKKKINTKCTSRSKEKINFSMEYSELCRDRWLLLVHIKLKVRACFSKVL